MNLTLLLKLEDFIDMAEKCNFNKEEIINGLKEITKAEQDEADAFVECLSKRMGAKND